MLYSNEYKISMKKSKSNTILQKINTFGADQMMTAFPVKEMVGLRAYVLEFTKALP
jgi:hypothetical protein